MSYFNRNKWWVIAFVLLIIMNLATLTTLWVMKDKRWPPSIHQRSGIVDYLVKELGFDSIQKKQLIQLRKGHEERLMGMRGKTRDAKDALFALLTKDDVPDSIVEKAAYASSENDQQIDVLTFRHFQKIRNLCTPPQKIKFNDIIGELIRSQGPPPSGNPNGPPPRREDRRREGPPGPGDDDRRPPPPPQQ